MFARKRQLQIFPHKAVVLAAGFGTRMLPLSLDTPKPMMPVWGKPILGHVLETLARWGVTDVLINLHHQPEAICRYLQYRRIAKLRVAFSFEPEILGTGGALRRGAWFLDNTPFWMINADVAFDLDPTALWQTFIRCRPLAALWMHPSRGPRTVEMTRGIIRNFHSSRPGTANTYTFCGLHLIHPDILSYVPQCGFSGIVSAYQRAMLDGHRIRGVCVPDAYWADIGNPTDYLKAHAEIRQRARRREPGWRLFDPAQRRAMTALKKTHILRNGFMAQGQDVQIAPGAVIANAVIWDQARIAGDAILENAIVGTACEVHGRVPQVAVRSDFSIGQAGDLHLAMALSKLGWDPVRTTVIPFEPRGSARVFIRLEYAGQRVIMIRYSLDRAENGLYAEHARFLKSIGIPVPQILLDVPEKQFLVAEDLGDQSLQRLLTGASSGRVMGYYRRLLPWVAAWHKRGTMAARRKRLEMVAPFSKDLYRWEREFFARHFLQPHLRLRAAEIRRILNELRLVGQVLNQAPVVLVHRDLQSSNILFHRGRPYFIDFQGMRFGPAAYDLASLLADPYAELALPVQRALLQEYNRQVSVPLRITENLFWQAVIERLAQALGAYGRLGALPDTAWFRRYIPAGLRMMQRALARVTTCPRLKAAVDNAIDNRLVAEENKTQ